MLFSTCEIFRRDFIVNMGWQRICLVYFRFEIKKNLFQFNDFPCAQHTRVCQGKGNREKETGGARESGEFSARLQTKLILILNTIDIWQKFQVT